MENRIELLKNKGYWIAKLQIDLYREIQDFMEQQKINKTQLAEYLGCSKGYASQLLNGDFDHKISKLVELSLAIGKVPQITYTDLQEYIQKEQDSYCIHITNQRFVPYKMMKTKQHLNPYFTIA